MPGFWYLATPYSGFNRGLEAAFAIACQAGAMFVEARIPVFVPIAHAHPLAVIGEIDPFDHSIWMPFDEPMMQAATGLVVLMADGWAESYGIREEIQTFKSAGKPIVYMTPGEMPAEIIAA